MNAYDDLPICCACGTQYEGVQRSRCPICDDPRQFVPPTGQAFTTLAELRKDHRNVFKPDKVQKEVTSIYTEPKFAIGQRCMLIETPAGNILWDLVSLVDQETVDFIKSKGTGKLKAIVISHPHFYTTNAVWAEVFDCPVYVASNDVDWLFSKPRHENALQLVKEVRTVISDGVTVIKCGGHFNGSLCLHWKRMLFSSDTIFTVPASRNPESHQFEQTSSYSFMWSIPNMIPLDPKTIHQIWTRLKDFQFETTFGNIYGLTVRNKEVKKRILQSAKNQVRRMGWEGKEEGNLILQEKLP